MKISIAMATYNGSQHIAEQIASLERQTRRPDEIIIVDDCSTDDTVAVIDSISRISAISFKIIKNERNLGVVANFNKAIFECDGDIIFMSDQDDTWYDTKIEEVVGAFAKQSVMVVINDQTISNSDLSENFGTKFKNIKKSGLGEVDFYTGCCTAIRKTWRNYIGPIPLGFPKHDYWFNVPAHLIGVRCILDRPLQAYRRHDSTVTTGSVSSVGGPTTRFKMSVAGLELKNPAPRLEGRVRDLEAIHAALAVSGRNSAFEEKRIRAVYDIQHEISELKARIEFVRMPRFKRMLKIPNALARGGYPKLSNLPSLVKDLLV